MVELLIPSSVTWPAPAPAARGPVAPGGHALATALDEVRRAPTILVAMRVAREVARVAELAVREGRRPGPMLDGIRQAIDDASDSVTAIAAIHALGRIPGQRAEAELRSVLESGRPGYAAHAAWAMIGRAPSRGLVAPLAGLVAAGGLEGMHAQRVLAGWGAIDPAGVVATLGAAYEATPDEAGRRYLTETLGLVGGRAARRRLMAVADDVTEPDPVRVAAVAAFTERLRERLPSELVGVGRETGAVADAVRLTRARRRLARRGAMAGHVMARRRRSHGIRVAQVHLGAVLDASVSQGGIGDTGGVATLLSRLGEVLGRQARIGEVLTVGRARAGEPGTTTGSGSHRFETVALEDGEGASFAARWPSLVAAERGIRAAFLGHGADVVHLRMGDPGSLAAARVARELGIPTVFTLAPDPHGPIAAAERSGSLDRSTFATTDARTRLWFRADLVERLADGAAELALFPRTDLRRRLRDLVGVDVGASPLRATVVPEGIDTTLVEEALRSVGEVGRSVEGGTLGDLARAIAALPHDRDGLPIVVSVGRLHEIKGMARVVRAFAFDDELAARANLVIVGGDLDRPSAAEAAELDRIRSLFDEHPGLASRVVLLGHRPNADVGLVLAAARLGLWPRIASGGAYVCGSLKEEFGLAIVEAMAAGLPVVAPRDGGPATYVRPGSTGVLVDTSDAIAVASAVHEALDLARSPGTAARAQATVASRFTLDRMAATLAAVYRIATAAHGLGLPVTAGP